MEQYKEVSLESINNGAALELFQEELKRVMGNINDVSISSDAPREIRLVFKIKPSKDRSSALTTIQASSKLVSTEHQSSIFISRQNCYVTNPKQEIFDFKKQQENEK